MHALPHRAISALGSGLCHETDGTPCLQLDATELGCSLASMSFADDPAVYYVVGTALAHPEESEPSKVVPRSARGVFNS